MGVNVPGHVKVDNIPELLLLKCADDVITLSLEHVTVKTSAVNLRLDLEVVPELLAVLLLGDEDDDGALTHELHQVLHQPLPLVATQRNHFHNLG